MRGTPDNPSPDVVYLNSLFSVPFALHLLRAARTLGIRVVLAPRACWARAPGHQTGQEKGLLTAARLLGLFRGVRRHASTEVERAEILNHLPGSDVHTAMNVPLFDANVLPISAGQGLTWVRVGRIHKKNLHFALEALQDVDLKGKHLRVELVGPAEDEVYLQHLLSLSKPGLDVVHGAPFRPMNLGRFGVGLMRC